MERCLLCNSLQLSRNLQEVPLTYKDEGKDVEFLGMVCVNREECDERVKNIQLELSEQEESSEPSEQEEFPEFPVREVCTRKIINNTVRYNKEKVQLDSLFDIRIEEIEGEKVLGYSTSALVIFTLREDMEHVTVWEIVEE